MRIVISEESRAEWVADFEKAGEARIRASLEFNTLSYSTEKLMLAREWLETRSVAAAARSELRSEESLSISRMALVNSKLATRIAILAIILSIIMATYEIIKWYSK